MKTEKQSAFLRWLPFIPAILALLVFGNSLLNQYTFDDHSVIQTHKFVQEGFGGLDDIFTTPYRWGNFHYNDGLYRPLSTSMFAIEVGLFGNNPLVHHLINVLLYALCGIFLTLLLLRWMGEERQVLVLITAVLFIVHPLHTEAVANIKGRDEILCFLFFTLSALAAIRYYEKSGITSLSLAGLFFILCFLSKEGAVTFTIVIPFSIFFFKGWKSRRLPILGGLYIGIATLMILLHTQIIHGVETPPPEIPSLLDNSVTAATGSDERIATGAYLVGKYILKCLFPHPLSNDYSYNQIPLQSFSSPWALLSILLIFSLGYFVLKGWENRSILRFGILFFLLTVSLYTNIYIFIGTTFAERLMFTPLLGTCLVVAYFLDPQQGTSTKQFMRFRNPRFLLLLLIVVVFSGKSMHRNAEWKTNSTLFHSAIETSPNSARVHFNYATAIEINAWKPENRDKMRPMLEEALNHFQKALQIYPAYQEAKNNLATLYIKDNRIDDALPILHTINRETPGFPQAIYNLGLVYFLKENYQESIKRMTEYYSLGPEMQLKAESHYYLGKSYGFLKNFDQAVIELETAVGLKPKYLKALVALGKAYGIMNRPLDSRNVLLQALKLRPNDIETNLNLGINYFNSGDYALASPHLQLILSLQPDHSKAQTILSDVLEKLNSSKTDTKK